MVDPTVFPKRLMLLGSGELGKEVVLAAQRLGQHVIAADSYDGAPAMQVADERVVVSMLDADALRAATSLDPTELRAMGARGRQWMQRDFSWEHVASKMAELYRSL